MEFLGLEVEGAGGDGRSNQRVEQYDIEHFKATIAAVLSHPEITGIAWTQYTPYFNDGEPCVFSASDPYFAFEGIGSDDEDADTYFDYSWMEDDFEESGRAWCGSWSNREVFHRIVGNDEKTWLPVERGQNWRSRGFEWKEGSGPNSAPNPQLFIDVHRLISLLDGGHYDHAVEDLFGDHAVVKIDKKAGKVIVDEYDHD